MAIIIQDLRPLTYDDIGPVSLNFDTIKFTLKKDDLLLDIECSPIDEEGRFTARCYEEPHDSKNLKILDYLDDICEHLWDDYILIEFNDDPLKLIPPIVNRFDDVILEQVYSSELNGVKVSSIDEMAAKFKYFGVRENNGIIIDIYDNHIYVFLTYSQEENIDECTAALENFSNYISDTLGLTRNNSLTAIEKCRMIHHYFEPDPIIEENYSLDVKTFRDHIVELNKYFHDIKVTRLEISHYITSKIKTKEIE